MQTRVAETGLHSRQLFLRTGVAASDNQARRLLNDIASFRAYLDQKDEQAGVRVHRREPLAGGGLRAGGPGDPRGSARPAAPAEIFHEILEHRWYMSEAAGRDVGTTAAARSYFRRILPGAPEPMDQASAAPAAHQANDGTDGGTGDGGNDGSQRRRRRSSADGGGRQF